MQYRENVVVDYEWLCQKANRELGKLWDAQLKRDRTQALDCALNAAMTIYHLLEWRHAGKDGATSQSARQLLQAENNPALNILHDVVTHTKHAHVSKAASGINLKGEVFIVQTGGVSYLKRSVIESGKIEFAEEDMAHQEIDVVMFGGEIAVGVLTQALEAFTRLTFAFRESLD